MPAQPSAKRYPDHGRTLLDSHISSDAISELDGPELIQPAQHDHRARFSIISGPAAETGVHPGCKGQRATWMRVLLLVGRTFQRSGYGLQDRLILCREDILERALTGTIPVRHEWHARYPRNQRHGIQRLEGCGFHRHVCNVEALGLEGPENRFDDPAPTVELRYPSRRFERCDPMAGQPAGGSISRASTKETA